MNLKYKCEWLDSQQHTHLIEIYTNDVVSNVETVLLNKCVFESPDNFILGEDVCNGCGGELSIISPSRLYYNDLYTSNIFKYNIKHYMNNVLVFNGYIDSENYNDKIAGVKNYLIDLKCNDGIAILDRLNYNDEPLTGIDSAINIIKACLNKLNLTFDNINIGLSTTLPNNTITDTLLHSLYCNKANYFDEKGVSMTCREVINTILLPLTARLFIYNNSVYIFDINTLAQNNLSYKQYSYSTLAYIQQLSINNIIELNELYNGDDLVGMQSGLNQINLKFKKYNYENNIEIEINEETINTLVQTQTYIKDDKTYTHNIYNQCDGIVRNSTSLVYVQQVDEDDNNEYYLRFTPTLPAPVGLYNVKMIGDSIFTINTGMFITSSQLVMKVEFEFMVEDLTRFKEEYECYVGNFGRGVCIKTNIDNYYQDLFGWTLNGNGYFLHDNGSTTYSKKVTANKWVKCWQYIPLNNDMYEQNKTVTNSGGELVLNYNACNLGAANLKWCIKNFKISFAEKDGFLYKTTKLSDNEITGYLNPDFKNDIDIDIMHGSDPASNSRGAFLVNVSGLYSDSDYATNQRVVSLDKVIRANQTATIEELMLNTYLSNYEVSRYTLNCSILDYYKPFNVFKYPLLERNNEAVELIPSSITVDYLQAQTSFTLNEFVADNLIITPIQ